MEYGLEPLLGSLSAPLEIPEEVGLSSKSGFDPLEIHAAKKCEDDRVTIQELMESTNVARDIEHLCKGGLVTPKDLPLFRFSRKIGVLAFRKCFPNQ